MPQHLNHRDREEDKKKDHKKILEEIIVENFPKMGKEIATQVQNPESPKQDKLRVFLLLFHVKMPFPQASPEPTRGQGSPALGRPRPGSHVAVP